MKTIENVRGDFGDAQSFPTAKQRRLTTASIRDRSQPNACACASPLSTEASADLRLNAADSPAFSAFCASAEEGRNNAEKTGQEGSSDKVSESGRKKRSRITKSGGNTNGEGKLPKKVGKMSKEKKGRIERERER